MSGVIDEIKERVSIVDVVGQRVQLKKSGRSLKALCPFHTEKTPSFYVFPESGTFKCFGCGAGGDIFTFLMRADNIEFGEALRVLAERAGVSLRPAAQAAAEAQQRGHVRQVLAAAAAYFHNLLIRSSQAQPAWSYLQLRGVTQATIESWQLGYAPDSWDALQTYMFSRGFTVEDMVAAGLIIEREGGGYYDRFRNRIVFPINDSHGNITGFGARALGNDKPKYLNSPQTILFDKSATLYGIDRAKDSIRQSGQAIIVEGYMDVLIPHQMGITNVVASLGTALTPRQMEQLKRLSKRLILALDADAAGDEATLRGLDVARDVLDREAVPVPTWRGLIRFEHVLGTDIRVLALPRGKDPDEVVLENPDLWRRLVDEALPVVDFYFNAVTARLDLRNPRDKAAVVDRLLPIVGEIVDDVVRSHYLQRLASMVQVDERRLAERLHSLRQPASRRNVQPESAPALRRQAARLALDDHCLAILLYEPTLYWKLPELALSPEDFPRTENREIFAAFRSFIEQNSDFDVTAFRQTIDATLLPHFDHLVRLGGQRPQAGGEVLEKELTSTVLRGRKQRLTDEINQLKFLQAQARQESDQSEMASLDRRVQELTDELARLNRRLDELTVLWKISDRR